MRHVEVVLGRRLVRPMVVVAALAAALAGCSPMEDQAVSASAGVTPPPAVAAPSPASKFQGSVRSVDAEGGGLVVSVWMVWTPVMDATAHDRRVLIDGATRWAPGDMRLGDVRIGEEVQVEGDPVGDDWRASKVQLFDVD
jgi:hypothetical protein